MAAATDIRATANTKAFYNKVKQAKRLATLPGDKPDYRIYAFDSGDFTPTFANTDDIGDELFVLQFPKGAKLIDFQIVSTADVDTGAAALVYNVISETTGGTETVLLSACQVGRTASDEDEMDRNLGNFLLDVGGQYFGLKITTPANANAGTGVLRIKGLFYMGDILTGF